MLLAWALVSLGVGVLAGFAVLRIWPDAAWAGPASTLVLWAAMLVPVGLAFRRSRPVGLLRLRPVDLLFGLTLGLLLRLVQGWLAGPDAGFPSFATVDGALPPTWWLTEALPAALVAPVVEEFFFRAVLVVAVYSLLRRVSGGAAAGVAAALVSTAVFVVMHTIGGAVGVGDIVAVAALGLTCALLVLLTGRIWAAVLTHIVYNTTWLLLGLVGTLAG